MTRTQFRLFVFAFFAISIIGGLYDFYQPDPVVAELTEIADDYVSEWPAFQMAIVGGGFVIGLITVVYSFIGLLLFWRHARWVYVAGFVVVLPIIPFSGITIMSGVGQLLYDIGSIASGCLLVLIFTQPVASYFERKANKSLESDT